MALNKQEIFDKVATHLLTQEVKSISWGESCRYRNNEGLKCVIGCLISDEHYKPFLERKAAYEWDVLLALYKSGINITGIDEDGINRYALSARKETLFIAELQAVHDKNDPKEWGYHLQTFAEINCLNYSVVTNFVKP